MSLDRTAGAGRLLLLPALVLASGALLPACSNVDVDEEELSREDQQLSRRRFAHVETQEERAGRGDNDGSRPRAGVGERTQRPPEMPDPLIKGPEKPPAPGTGAGIAERLGGVGTEDQQSAAVYKEATAAFDDARYEEAAEGFRRYVVLTRFGGRAEEASFLASEALFRLERYEAAYDSYRRFLDDFPHSARRVDVGDRMHQIGVAFVTGRAEKKGFFGVSIGDRTLGRDILEVVVRDYEFEDFADDALFHLAEDSLKNNLPDQAAEELRDLIFRYPKSEWVPIAEYKLAQALMDQSNGYVYDVSAIRRAERQLADYLVTYPEGDRANEAQEMLGSVRHDLAERELTTARFYARTGKDESARVYLEGLIRDYPDTDAATTARELLADLGYPVPTPSALAERPRTEQERRAALGLPELRGPEFAPSTPPPVDPGRTTSEGDY